MLGLSVLDIVVLIAYFGVIVVIGVRASFKIKDKEDFFLGGRKFGKLVSTFASFGQATSADGPAGVATTTFNNGASGVWSSLLMLFATPLFWVTSPWLRRLRILTMGDFYLERYGSKKMAATYAIVASIGMMGLLSVGYFAVTKTAVAMTAKAEVEYTIEERQEAALAKELKFLEAENLANLTPEQQERLDELRQLKPRSIFSHINEDYLIWGICLLVLVYTALGGLEAAFYTDLLQGVFIIILSIILIPFALGAINDQYGGSGAIQALTHLHDQLPENYFEIFGSPAVIDFTWYFIIVAAVVSIVTVVTQPNQLVTSGAAKDEYSARFGFVTGTFIKRAVTILWGVLGITALLLYHDTITNPDLVWGYATKALLGPLNLGLVGLMMASLMAALMSTADTLMVTVSGLIVNNLYRPFTAKKSETHYLWAGRLSGGIYLIGAAIVTTQFDEILQILKFVWEFFVIFAAAFWLGLKWRRANVKAAWASIIATFSLFYMIPIIIAVIPGVDTTPSLLKKTQPEPVERIYTAKVIDVTNRNKEIEQWIEIEKLGRAIGERPQKIEEGEKIQAYFSLPQKSIFWSKGIKNGDGEQEYGSGYIFLELYFIDSLGFDLSQNPYALNESIRLMIRLIFPFLILIIVALLTKPDEESLKVKFFNKMRIRVNPNGKEADDHDIEQGLENPASTEQALIFPKSEWEFYRWNKKDWFGFMISWIMVLVIIAALYSVFTIGG